MISSGEEKSYLKVREKWDTPGKGEERITAKQPRKGNFVILIPKDCDHQDPNQFQIIGDLDVTEQIHPGFLGTSMRQPQHV